ncbi:hypothetical protein E1281_29185 [Actinomadura sp. KC345]|uniref:hypothetical protein n=1 Tax=Actinomadura sp. KC345 TaxID=2530371 RepID=UPI00104975D6|nr:hypothetical protein [Actinomadura sp. KC345]TDC45925.1 hypothetical protein E1281_29185 [Actinomadura sp. KC345]
MSALLARLIDDAALFPPERAPMDQALAAHRAVSDASRRTRREPLVGRFLCPASRFAELRTHLVPEDLLDLGFIADTGLEELPKALDAVRAEPRVRPSSVEIALPRDADQARAAAVTIARLPPGVPTRIEVRRSPGWLHALDRIASARASFAREGVAAGAAGLEQGDVLGAKVRVDGTPAGEVSAVEALAAFISGCAERDLPFTCACRQGPLVLPAVLLATAHAAAGDAERGVRRVLERGDAGAVARDLLALTGAEARAARRLLVAFGTSGVLGVRAELAAAGLIRTPETGEDTAP